MTKNYAFIVIVLLMSLIVTACSKATAFPPQRSDETSMQWQSFNSENEVLLNDLRERRGYFIFEASDAKPDDLYLGVFMGTKPSSDYDVLMGSVLLGEDGLLIITVKEIFPTPGLEVSDVELYPYLLFMIPDAADKEFTIVSEDGEEFTLLEFIEE